jgi:hypothetical protein
MQDDEKKMFDSQSYGLSLYHFFKINTDRPTDVVRERSRRSPSSAEGRELRYG